MGIDFVTLALAKKYTDEKGGSGTGVSGNFVAYDKKQNLTNKQKAQARANIGAGTSDFSGSWNDLEDKPFGIIAVKGEVIMTTVNVPVFTGKYYSCTPSKSSFPNQNEGAINMVEFDGKEYVCPVEIRNINNPARWEFIAGNAHLMDSTSEDNGMPFCVHFARGSAGHKIYVTDNTATHVITVYNCTSGIEQIDEKFIPDTIARIEDFTILPIERIGDFGPFYERRNNGSVCTHMIYLTNAMAGIDNYIFKVQKPEGYLVQDVKLRYMNPDGSVSIPKGLSSLTNTIYLWFSIDANRDRAVAHELLSNMEWRFTYDVNGAYVNDTITFNITSDNLITQFNSLSIASSYVPSLVTDVATKGYVDSAIPEIATDDEILELLAQEDMFPVVMDSDGSILADENENILLW